MHVDSRQPSHVSCIHILQYTPTHEQKSNTTVGLLLTELHFSAEGIKKRGLDMFKLGLRQMAGGIRKAQRPSETVNVLYVAGDHTPLWMLLICEPKSWPISF